MLYAIRGATVASDTNEDIMQKSIALYNEIIEQNNLIDNIDKQIVDVFISVTKDLQSEYPAKGVRQSKYYRGEALFSCLEPDVKGSLKKGIRFLIHCEIENKNFIPRHVYLNKAKILRPDISNLNICIDGPAGAGKTTVAKKLAGKMSISYLDTGAMYRAITIKMIDAKLYNEDKCAFCGTDDNIKQILNLSDIKFKNENGEQLVFLNDEDVTAKIRMNNISKATTVVSANKIVRDYMVEKQRQIAKQSSCVLDGRDTGSFVLKDADYKFFLTASIDVRAKRRLEELEYRTGKKYDIKTIKKEIENRDNSDREREFSPLVQAKDAILIDTSHFGIDEMVEHIYNKLYE